MHDTAVYFFLELESMNKGTIPVLLLYPVSLLLKMMDTRRSMAARPTLETRRVKNSWVCVNTGITCPGATVAYAAFCSNRPGHWCDSWSIQRWEIQVLIQGQCSFLKLLYLRCLWEQDVLCFHDHWGGWSQHRMQRQDIQVLPHSRNNTLFSSCFVLYRSTFGWHTVAVSLWPYIDSGEESQHRRQRWKVQVLMRGQHSGHCTFTAFRWRMVVLCLCGSAWI